MHKDGCQMANPTTEERQERLTVRSLEMHKSGFKMENPTVTSKSGKGPKRFEAYITNMYLT